MQHPSSWSTTAPVEDHAPVNGGVISVTLPSSYAQQPPAIRGDSSGSPALYSPSKLTRRLRGSADESGDDSPEPPSPPTSLPELLAGAPCCHHDDDFTQFLFRPWYAEEGNFENKDEDLSIASSISTLWSSRVRAPRQEPVTSKEDTSILLEKLGLQVTSLATPKPLSLSRPRQRAVFSSARAARLCKGFPDLTAAAGCAPGSGDHRDVLGDIERGVRPQESGDNVSCDVRFDSEPATPRASAGSTDRPKDTEIHQGDVTPAHSSSLDVNEARYVLLPDGRLRQARTTRHSKLTTEPHGSDPDSLIPTLAARMSPTMTSPQRTKMTINKTRPSMRTATATGKSWNESLAAGTRKSPTPSTTRRTRARSPTQVPHTACCTSTPLKKYTEGGPIYEQSVWTIDTLGTMDSTSEFPTIDSFRPLDGPFGGLPDCVIDRRAGDFTDEKVEGSSKRTEEVSASGDFRASPAGNEKAEPLISLGDDSSTAATAGSIRRESGEVKTPTTTSASSGKDNVGSFSDFFSGVVLDPHFTSTPITIHKDLGDSPSREDTSWKGFDVFPHSEYFKTFELFPGLAGAEEKSMSMSGEVYESLSTGFPPSKGMLLASTTDDLSDRETPGVEGAANAVQQSLPPPRECMSSVDSFFTVPSFDEDSLSTVMCQSPVRNFPPKASESLCPNSPSSRSNWTFYSASTTGSSLDGHDLSPGSSQQDFIDLTLFHSSIMMKPESSSSAASAHHVDSACQASSVITSQDSFISSSKTTEQGEPSDPQGFLHGSGGSDAVRLIPWPEDDSAASQGSRRDASQNSERAGNHDCWNSFQRRPGLGDRSPYHSSGGSPSRWSDSEEWKRFISGAESESSASTTDESSFYSYDGDFNAFRALRNSMVQRYLKLSGTTEMLLPVEHRPRPHGEGAFESDFTSTTPHTVAGGSLKSASSDTTISRSEATRSVLSRFSSTSLSMPDLSHLDGCSRAEGSFTTDLAYSSCVADGDSNELSTSRNGVRNLAQSQPSAVVKGVSEGTMGSA